jgi:predicted phosphodiesterase
VGEVASVCGVDCSSTGGGGAPDLGTPPGTDGGGTGGTGGKLLTFAVFGDCRPPTLEATSSYPSQIISGIFSLAQTKGAQFMIGTGDYMFSNTSSGVSAQVQLFEQARANYTGPVYLAMGNHECNGRTNGNCPNLDETPNVKAFLGLLPSGVTKPYYRLDMPTPLGSAKFLFVAANAWDSTQESWLQQELADATTYTFVMRHEPAADTTAPGVSPSESLMKQASYTLALQGHTHEYRHVDTKHVISGNAGAPLQSSSGSSYGMLLVQQQANGNINVSEIEEATGNVLDSWSVTPDGQAAN